MNSSKKKSILDGEFGAAIIGANASTNVAIAFGMTGVGFLPTVAVIGVGAVIGIALEKAAK